MKEILCLSGWGQKSDSLENIFSDKVFDPFFVSSFNYLVLDDIEDFFDKIKKNPHAELIEAQSSCFDKLSMTRDPEVIVGWSLGGQLAVRLIEKKIFTPKLLILIAPPFQMIKDERIQAGMSPKTFAEFYGNFVKSPDKTLKQFAILNAMNDRNAKEIAKTLDVSDNNFLQLKFWLEELERFSCFDVDFSNMPRTLFLQGLGDAIVHISQADYFKQRIGDFRLELFKNCGHAPHLNDVEMVRKVILEEIGFLHERVDGARDSDHAFM